MIRELEELSGKKIKVKFIVPNDNQEDDNQEIDVCEGTFLCNNAGNYMWVDTGNTYFILWRLMIFVK